MLRCSTGIAFSRSFRRIRASAHAADSRLDGEPERERIGQLVAVLQGETPQLRSVWRGPGVGDERAAEAATPRGDVPGAVQLTDRLSERQPADSELGGQVTLRRESLARPDHAELDDGEQPLDCFLERIPRAHRT